MKIFFVAVLLIFAADMVLMCRSGSESAVINDWRAQYDVRKMPLVKRIAFIASACLFIIGISDMTGLLHTDGFHCTFFLMGTSALIGWHLSNVRGFFPAGAASFALKALTAAALLELTVFNAPSYRVMTGKYPELIAYPSQGIIESDDTLLTRNGGAFSTAHDWIITTFEDIDIPVRTVYTDLTFTDNVRGVAMLKIDAKDQTRNSDYRYDIGSADLAAARNTSRYTTLDLSGEVTDIRIKVCASVSGEVQLNSVVFNAMIPFEIYLVRLLFIVLGSTFIYMLLHGTLLSESCRKRELLCRVLTVGTACICCAAAFTAVQYKLGEGTWKELVEYEEGNQVSRELVEVIEHRHAALETQPSEELLAMDNPYDNLLREQTAGFEWDHVFYEGKYYSYYGIAPVVLLFVPFHKITGHYLPDEIAVTVFAVIGFIGLAMLLLRFMKNWFMDIPVGIYFSAMVMIFLNCGIWFSIGRTDFYETATASGFAFLTWGAYFLLRCGAVGGEKRSLLFTALSSLFFAVAVLCRPTLALYCICAAVMLLLAYPRFAGAAGDEKTADKGKVKKSVKGKVKKSGNGRKGKAAQPAKKPFFTRSGAIYIACAFVPMAALGIAQMLYNHARFGSFFEFGIQYSLTINDFTKAEFHPALSWIALFNYYLAPPAFSADYPQISTVFQRLGVNGFFYQDEATVNTSGLLWLIPPLWAYLAGGRALRQLPDRRTRLRTFGMVFFPCLLIPLTIVAVVWESGYSARYFADFSWQLMLGAYAVLFFLYSKAKDDTARTMYKIFFGTSLLWSMVVSGVQVFDFVFRCSGEHMDHPEMRYIVDSLFAFWR